MYYCQSCCLTFATPRAVFETHGLSSPPYERLNACPRCQSTDITVKI